MEAVVVSLVESFHDVREDSGVFASGSADGNAIAPLEETPGNDRVVNFSLEEEERGETRKKVGRKGRRRKIKREEE